MKSKLFKATVFLKTTQPATTEEAQVALLNAVFDGGEKTDVCIFMDAKDVQDASKSHPHFLKT
jgi:hypothetical protein